MTAHSLVDTDAIHGLVADADDVRAIYRSQGLTFIVYTASSDHFWAKIWDGDHSLRLG